MELITFESDAFNKIMSRIDNLSNKIDDKIRTQPLEDIWLDIQETCQLLKISKRTLQAYRDNNVLSFSQIGGKIYFKATDIDAHLKKHYYQCESKAL